jgi:hypothetical protein
MPPRLIIACTCNWRDAAQEAEDGDVLFVNPHDNADGSPGVYEIVDHKLDDSSEAREIRHVDGAPILGDQPEATRH